MYPDERWRRRRRRRRRFVILAVIASLVALWALAGTLRRDDLAVSAFLDEVRSTATNQAQRAADFQDFLTAPSGRLEREPLTAFISQSEAALSDARESIEELELPPEALGARRLMVLSFESWEQGLGLIESAALQLPDDELEPLARLNLADGFLEMEIGDRLFSEFVVEATRLQEQYEEAGRPVPTLRYLTDAARTSAYVQSLADQIVAAPAMEAQPSLVVGQLVLEPPVTGGERNGLPVVPFTDRVTIQVPVSNNGNEPLDEIEVVVSLRDASGSLLETRSDDVPRLEAGQSTTAVFEQWQVTTGTYSIEVVLNLAALPDQASERYMFVVLEPSS